MTEEEKKAAEKAGTGTDPKGGDPAAAAAKKPEEIQAENERLQAELQKKELELKESQTKLNELTDIKTLLEAQPKKAVSDPETDNLKRQIDADFGEGAADRMMALIERSQAKTATELKNLIGAVKAELGKRLAYQEEPELRELKETMEQVEKDLRDPNYPYEKIIADIARGRKMPDVVKKAVEADRKVREEKEKGAGTMDFSGSLQPEMSGKTSSTLSEIISKIKEETRKAPVGSTIFKPKG